MPGHEPGGGRLFGDYVDNVLAVEPSGLAEEGLLAVVVVVRAVLEPPAVVPVGIAGQLRGHGPASEGPGALLYVVFGVVELHVLADAHGEQLQKLTPVVLVGSAIVVLVVVQPVDHGRVLGQLDEDGAEAAHGKPTEELQLLVHLRVAVHLGVTGGKDVVPEQGHLLFQRTLGRHHAVHPVGLVRGDARPHAVVGNVAVGQVVVEGRLLLGVEQFLHGGLVSLGQSSFQLVAVGAEPGAAHQVGHQGQVFTTGHILCPFPGVKRPGTLEMFSDSARIYESRTPRCCPKWYTIAPAQSSRNRGPTMEGQTGSCLRPRTIGTWETKENLLVGHLGVFVLKTPWIPVISVPFGDFFVPCPGHIGTAIGTW